jgi:transposase
MIHVCEHCSGVWDQDENAARNIFAGPRERSDAELPTEERSRD